MSGPQPYNTTMNKQQLIKALQADIAALYAAAGGAGTVTSVGITPGSSDVTSTGGPIVGAGNITVDLSAAVKTALAAALTALQSISIATGTGLTGGPLAASGSTVALSSTSIADLALAATAAQPASGTFTITYTGFGSTVTGTAKYYVVGDVVVLTLPAGSGTSNATSFTATGLPAAIQPATANTMGTLPDNVVQNSGAYVGCAFTISGGTMTFFNGGSESGTSWTASGTKGFLNAAFAVYSIQ